MKKALRARYHSAKVVTGWGSGILAYSTEVHQLKRLHINIINTLDK